MLKTCNIGKTALSVSCARFKSHICKIGCQRKVREGIESLYRTIHNRKKVLNSFESLMPWRPLLDKYFDRDNVNTCMRLF